MAFDFFAGQDPNQQKQNQGQPVVQGQNQGIQTQAGGGQALGPASQLVTGNSPSQGNAAPGGANNGFTNLQSYLDANAGKGFGTQLAGKAQGVVDNATNAQNQTQQNFQNQVNQTSVQANQQLLDQVAKDPTQVANNQDQYNSFAKMRDANYQGPQNIAQDSQDFTKANNATQNAQQTANSLTTEGGRNAFLQQQYGSGVGNYGYTGGLQKLDNLLFSNDPNSQKAILGVQQSGNNAANQWNQLQNTLNNYAQNASQQTQAARNAARSAVDIDNSGNLVSPSNYTAPQPRQIEQGASATQGMNAAPAGTKIGNLQQQALEQANQYNTKKATDVANIQKDLASRNLTNPEMALTGLKQGQSLYNAGLGPMNLGNKDYLTEANDVNANQAATAQQQAQVAALSKLANLQNVYLNPNAGGMPQQEYTYDKDKLATQLSGNQNQYNTLLNVPQYQIQDNGTFGQSGGSDTGPKPQAMSIPSVLNAELTPASLTVDQGDNFGSSVTNYQKALNALKTLQQSQGFEDTIGNTTPTGDWSGYRDFSNAIAAGQGGVPSNFDPTKIVAPSQANNPIYGNVVPSQQPPASAAQNPNTVHIDPTKVRFFG